ncbi:MAG: 4-(cytidine 5'-diphospho)-2-C-methyl-D-erythritol kinase [Lachnospiraceae bacterium]|nr:4-(cytidine 5'-diphospho)-2-C-methyl-D-erythritol kinase [Lachnospiraceae bacterium]
MPADFSGRITRKAYGKINLALDITGKREDGYHLVKMILQTVDLYDQITVERLEEGIVLTCDDPRVPTGEKNLAYKAARLMIQTFGLTEGVKIHIEKKIPMQGGMGGGSTDAAAVILAVNELFDLHADTDLLDKLAVTLGADVPFCLREGTYLAEGIGEKLTALPDAPHGYLVLIVPSFGISTAWAYARADEMEDLVHPDIAGMVKAIEKQDLVKMASGMGNILEQVAITEHPEIQAVKDQLLQHGALGAMMTGSGSVIFGIFDDQKKADLCFETFKGETYGKFKSQL